MLYDTFGLIYSGEENWHLKDFTLQRSVASVPFGGRYRAIDFPLSNMVNSGITSVGVMTQRNYSSLMDHLGSGAHWDLNRKRDGLYILPPFNMSVSGAEPVGGGNGSVDALQSAVDYIEHTRFRYAMLQTCNYIFNLDYSDFLEFHVDQKADITCLYFVDPPQYKLQKGYVEDMRFIIDKDQRVENIEINSRRPLSHNTFLECAVMDKQLMLYLLEDAVNSGARSFTQSVLQRKLKDLRVCAYRFDGYVGNLKSVKTMFDSNMDLLNPLVRKDIFNMSTPILTKVKDEVPTLYKSCSSVKNVMVSDGCIIEGEIENSILSRGIKIGQGSKIKNCVIMQGSEIGENVELEHVILDKEVTVRKGRRLIGTEEFPIAVRKNTII